MDYCIADSNYNRKELLGMGYENVDVMPIQISLDRFDHVRSEVSVLKEYEKYNPRFSGTNRNQSAPHCTKPQYRHNFSH